MSSQSLQVGVRDERPAIAGGKPSFPRKIPIVRPEVPALEPLLGDLRSVLASGVLTNGPNVQKLERAAAEFLGVQEAVAVSSCTSGLAYLNDLMTQ